MFVSTDYLQRVWRLRYFWMSLVQKDLRSRYRNSVLGIGWSLLRPLAMTTVLCVVFSKVFNIALAEYAPFLLTGLTLWQFLTECINGGCATFTQSSGYIRQRPVPLAIFPLRTVLGAGFHSLIAIGIAIFAAALFRGGIPLSPLIHVLAAIPICLFLGWAIAILCGIAYVHFSDMQQLLEIGLQILFYATPIMYPMEALQGRNRLLWMLQWNPLAHLLEIVRSPIVKGTVPTLENYAVAVGFSAAMILLASVCLRRVERHLVFWI
jgi:lipopolysaccharide transport system permease protein